MDADMDIDNDHWDVVNEDVLEQVVEVMPDVRVITKPKAKRYDNSVSSS
jgi:division protein CdvB (Snf7/Vps24/ESCRT-III family)